MAPRDATGARMRGHALWKPGKYALGPKGPTLREGAPIGSCHAIDPIDGECGIAPIGYGGADANTGAVADFSIVEQVQRC